jgi:hypothetical protein
MSQLIGIALVLTLAVMPAPVPAQGSGQTAPITPSLISPAGAVAVPNFISYRDRSSSTNGTNASTRDQPFEPVDEGDPTGFLGASDVAHPLEIRDMTPRGAH